MEYNLYLAVIARSPRIHPWVSHFLFLIAATIAATAPIAAPMAANIETVTHVCCSIVSSLRFPFSVPSF